MIQGTDNIDDLMNDDDDLGLIRDGEDEGALEQLITIDLDAVDADASHRSEIITDSLSNYYFDEKYIKDHPYIPTKIMQEMDNVRRLYKMLLVNEKAQDALIKAISMNAAKGTLYLSLTSMQKSILLIQKQLNDMVTNLETIFQRMQDEADKMYSEKDKEENDDGSLTIRGARDFIKMMQDKMHQRKQKDGSIIDTRTGKTLLEDNKESNNADVVPEGATSIDEIVG